MKSFYLRHKLISSIQDINIKGSRRLAYLVVQLLIPRAKKSLIVKTLYGFNMKIDPVKDKGVEKSLYYTGTYEKGTLDILKNLLSDGDVFIDIGANIGLMSIFASSLVKNDGKVIAFEPNPDTRQILNENIILNSIGNIEVSSYALGSITENTKIYDRWDSNRGSASLIRSEGSTEGHDIKVIRLSDYINSNTKISLIKLDIEGYELEALKGADHILQRKNPPMLIVEFSHLRENKLDQGTNKMYELIKSFNYRLFKPIGGKGRLSKLVEVTQKSELPNHDNIYCFTNEHLRNLTNMLFKKKIKY